MGLVNNTSATSKISVLQFIVWTIGSLVVVGTSAIVFGKLELTALVVPFVFTLFLQALPALAVLSIMLSPNNPYFLVIAAIGTIMLAALIGYLSSFATDRKKQLVIFFALDILVIAAFAATLRFFPLLGALAVSLRDM